MQRLKEQCVMTCRPAQTTPDPIVSTTLGQTWEIREDECLCDATAGVTLSHADPR